MDRFADRIEAGVELATLLKPYGNRRDVVVLALPRGGVPVAFEVARALRAPLDVFIVRKLGLPAHPELAIGAIASGGVRVLNDDVVQWLEISPATIDAVAHREQVELERRERLFRGDRPPLDIDGKTVLLIDDGLATGSTMKAAVQALRAEGPNATRKVINPTTGAVIATVPEATADDVSDAVTAARAAFDAGPWSTTTHRERGSILFKVAEGIRARAAELAETDTRNMGKPIVEAEIDAADAAHCFEYYAGMASKVHGRTLPVPDNALSLTMREPVGVVGQIVPWNYPLLMSAWKLAPALAAGCTSIFKPAEQSPLSALLLADILDKAGVPKGVINIVTGDAVAGSALVADPRVDKLAFTGSTDAGKNIVKSAADTVKRTTMELGGKNPNLVFADADFEAAVDGALFGAFANQGEVCSAGSRLLVEHSIYEKICEALAKKVTRVKVGDPLVRDTKMGPLVTAEHRDRVMQYIEIGKREATLLCGGHAVKGDGWFVEPTIFRDVDNTMRIARDEIFGPVLAVIPFETEEDAVRIANDTVYGLAGAVWTRNLAKGLRVLKQMRAGILWLNTYHPTYNEAPWGGYKQSGFGRELGVWGFENYLETKQININLNEAPLGWY